MVRVTPKRILAFSVSCTCLQQLAPQALHSNTLSLSLPFSLYVSDVFFSRTSPSTDQMINATSIPLETQCLLSLPFYIGTLFTSTRVHLQCNTATSYLASPRRPSHCPSDETVNRTSHTQHITHSMHHTVWSMPLSPSPCCSSEARAYSDSTGRIFHETPINRHSASSERERERKQFDSHCHS